jgi:hypothetical protein
VTARNPHIANSLSQREIIGKAALRAFFCIARAWGIEESDQCRLLGGISREDLLVYRGGSSQGLSSHVLKRIKLFVLIHKALRSQYPDEGDLLSFLFTPNASFPYLGVPPVRLYVQGSICDLKEVSRSEFNASSAPLTIDQPQP